MGICYFLTGKKKQHTCMKELDNTGNRTKNMVNSFGHCIS